MKTAVSIPDDIFEELSKAAEEENTSRSRLLTEAVRDFLEKRRNRQMLKILNDVYSEPETAEEKKERRAGKASYARNLRREKW